MNRPPRKEILRYLGYKGMACDSKETGALIEKCMTMLEPVLFPRSCVRFYPVTFTDDMIVIESLRIHSRSLARNLKGCTQAALMACTLGIETDRLIQRKQLTSLSESAVLDAMASACIESYCDEINAQIIEKAGTFSLYCRPRFSPGYGDLPLSLQKDIFNLMPITKETGIALTDSCLMVPSKSVTAIIGMSPVQQNCILQGCEECALSDECMYSRKE